MNDIQLVLKAAAFAAAKHRDQRRKDAAATPYINHPISLAQLLAEEAGVTDPEILAAALLHDTVEDTETTFEELGSTFGHRVAAIVAEVTDDKSLEKQERKRMQIVRAASSSGSAKLVKLADKICNLRDIVSTPPKDWSTKRRQEYFDWAKEVVDQVRGVSPVLAAEFDRTCAMRPVELSPPCPGKG